MKNWAGNLEYASSEVRQPSSVEELADIVAGARRVKALGSRHSFNRVGDTDGVHVLLDGLPREIELDPERRTVRVSGGVSYGTLCRSLEQSGVPSAYLRGGCGPDGNARIRGGQPVPGRCRRSDPPGAALR